MEKTIELVSVSDRSTRARTAEVTVCGDSGQYGVIVWLGTRDKRRASRLAKEVVKRINRRGGR